MSYFFLIPISITLGLTGLGAFFWAMRNNQYDDLDGAAARILISSDQPLLGPETVKKIDEQQPSMTAVTVTASGFEVDAALIAMAFGLDPATLQMRMRAGEVTSVCEAGVDADLGRFRLTFRHAGRALRLTVDSEGRVVTRATFPVSVKAKAQPPQDT